MIKQKDVLALRDLVKAIEIERARYALVLDKFVVMGEKTTWGRRQVELKEDDNLFGFLEWWDVEAARKNPDNAFVKDALVAHERLALIYDSVGDLTMRLKDLLDFQSEDDLDLTDFLTELASLSDRLYTVENALKEVGGIPPKNEGLKDGGIPPKPEIPETVVFTPPAPTRKETILTFLNENVGKKFTSAEIAKCVGLTTSIIAPVLTKLLHERDIRRVRGKYWVDDKKKQVEKPVEGGVEEQETLEETAKTESKEEKEEKEEFGEDKPDLT